MINIELMMIFIIALALQFLRSKGIAHMDLKPQNLLLTAPPKAILKIGGTFITS